MLRRLLVGFDASGDARAAVQAAVGLASATDGEVTVVAVVSESRGETEVDRRAAFEAEAGALGELAAQAVADCHQPEVRVTVEPVGGDRPGRTLMALAARGGYDLLVVGRHGRERTMHGGVGKVAREVVEQAGCAVLVVTEQVPRPS